MKSDVYLKAQGRILKLTHLAKIMYPKTGFRKGDVIRYYKAVAPTVLPHLRNRPFTLRRFPQGVEAEAFFEKQCPHHRPSWVQTGYFGSIRHCLVNDLPTLLWIANLAALELHTTLALVSDLRSPTMVAFDLDPGEAAGIRECVEVALLLRTLLDSLALKCFPKTSGKKGLHVYVPVNSSLDYDFSKPFARSIAERLEQNHPDLVTSKMPKKLRRGRVFIDWSQNTDFKTTTTVYSLRANDRPTVSTPLSWEELERARRRASSSEKLLQFETDEVLDRIRSRGDLFAPVLSLRQRLPAEIRFPLRKSAA